MDVMGYARWVSIDRKCARCGKRMRIAMGNVRDYVVHGGKAYHRGCFEATCRERAESGNSRVSEKWGGILSDLASVEAESDALLARALIKQIIYEFARESYGLEVIPSRAWRKMARIYDGTYMGMRDGIPPEHLLDMWQRKMPELRAIAQRNEANGKTMPPEDRLVYDLSILVDRYDSYLRWLESHREEVAVPGGDLLVRDSIGYSGHAERGEGDISGAVADVFG